MIGRLVESDNMQTAGVGLGQLLLALDTTVASLVEAPRGLDLTVASAALIDSDDVRLGLGRGADSADVFFLLGVSDDEASAGSTPGRPGALRWPSSPRTLRCAGGPGRRGRHCGGGRGTAGPLGTDLPAGRSRARAPWRPGRPTARLRHRLVRPGAVAGRPYPRHGQHRRRAIARVGVFGVQRRSRRVAAAVDPGPRRSARAPDVDRSVGHLRCAAGRQRGGPDRRATRTGPATAARGRHSPAQRRCPSDTGFRRRHLGAAGVPAAGGRRRGGDAGSRGTGRAHHVPADAQGRRRMRCAPSSCWAWSTADRSTSTRSVASWASSSTATPP